MALGDDNVSPGEHRLLDDVTKRVRLWNEVEPFYPDQTRGLPKTSESRGTEAVMNALILATRDASTGVLSDDARQALNNMWALQFKAGELKGAWAWLNFHYEPWEAPDSGYFGATLGAIAAGTAPGGYSSNSGIQEQMKLLRDYLQQRADTERLFNRIMVLWASATLPGILTPAQSQAIIDAGVVQQQDDGGWSTASLGSWKRVDSSKLDTTSDGYATGLVTLALQRAGVSASDAHVGKGLSWLARHQDASTGMWHASSLNKERDPASDIGKFMSDAATAYAILALTAEAAQRK
jgi:squalene-hopene/tetraprenyl-beta-curcumene cyclase